MVKEMLKGRGGNPKICADKDTPNASNAFTSNYGGPKTVIRRSTPKPKNKNQGT